MTQGHVIISAYVLIVAGLLVRYYAQQSRRMDSFDRRLHQVRWVALRRIEEWAALRQAQANRRWQVEHNHGQSWPEISGHIEINSSGVGRIVGMAHALLFALLLTGCGGQLPPVKVCPDGTVTTGTCPSPPPTAPPSTPPTTAPTAPPTTPPTAPPSTPPSTPPSAPPTPAPSGCDLPRGTGTNDGCRKSVPAFAEDVSRAIDKVLATRPDLVTADGARILNSAGYHAEVVHRLQSYGLCAAFVDGEEIAIKRSNDFSEQWDIESSVRRSIRLYTVSCTPAHENIPGPGPGQGPPAPDPDPEPCPPAPAPCTPTGWKVDCRNACDAFWADALARKAAGGAAGECHWHPINNNTLLIGWDSPPFGNHRPCNVGADPNCCNWEPLPWEIASAPRAVNRNCDVIQGTTGGVVWSVNPWRENVEGFDYDATRPDKPWMLDEQGDKIPVTYFGSARAFGCTVEKPKECAPGPPQPPCGPPPPPPPAGECPNITAFGTNLHSVICNGQVNNGPDGHTPAPKAGCRHSITATGYFGGSGNFYRCSECGPPFPSKNGCCNGLGQTADGTINRCDDARGPEWWVNGQSHGRTWRLILDALPAGTYRVDACAPANDWTDYLGRTHAGGGCSVSPVTLVVP